MNRERLQNGDVFTKFDDQASEPSAGQAAAVDEHFSVDGTLIDSLGFTESFAPRMAAVTMMTAPTSMANKRKNDTHASTSDPDSRLYRKAAGREAKLCYMGHATMENRHGWLAGAGRSRMPMAPPNAELRRPC